MCGIAGFLSREPDAQADPIIRRMTGEISHRGPDADGFHVDARAALGHRRLSIIDLAAGQQPMYNESGSICIIFNGEIYNHADLRPELERAGHIYQSHCDTETIIHAYEEWGPDCLLRFRGMFAFAIWDRDRRELFCARDRLGIKPFYYALRNGHFIFGSEIKALLKHPALSAKFEDSLLPEYLAFGYTSGDRTLFSGVRKLMPGHWLKVRAGATEPEIAQYWEVPSGPAIARSEAETLKEVRGQLEEAVRTRLMSDVPLGVFLSGGVDSSVIAALMQRMVTEKVKTFSVGYREEQYSELGYARTVAERLGTDHHEITVGMDEFFNTLPKLVWHEDEPIAWPSSISLYHVSELASRKVKVVLTGEGSDELFGGYGRYSYQLFNQKWAGFYGAVPGPVRSLVRRQIAGPSLLSGDMRRKLRHTFLGRTNDLRSLYLDNFYGSFPSEEAVRAFRIGEPGRAYENYMRYWDAVPQLPSLERMLWADKKTYLVELLMKQDQMSMAASIESRVPFLDHPFVEFSTTIDPEYKIRNGEAKYALKKAVEDLLPHDIIYRKKMGFPTPIKQWLRQPEASPLYELLEKRDGLLADYCDGTYLKDLLARHRNGTEDATDRIWNLLNLQVWGETFLTGRKAALADGILPVAAAVS
jgi:asparagine synthase (glutamine-hydrolysing)